jgi:hypothetical protein
MNIRSIPLAIIRALALTAAVCCAVVVVSGLPDITPRNAFILAVSGAVIWGERLSPLPWMLAWWCGGFLGVVPRVLVALALAVRCARANPRTPWAPVVALAGLWFSTVLDGPSNMERAHPEHADIVCLGDCSSAGNSAEDNYCALLGGENFSVPGASPTQTLAQWDAAQQLSPRIVLWQAGPNVKSAAEGALPQALATIAREATQDGARLVVVEYPVTLWPEPDWRRQAREGLPDGATLIDPHLRWWEIDGDHLHPTAAGHRRIAAAVAEALQ